MNEEYQLYLELKEKYGEFETEAQFWENQGIEKVVEKTEETPF